MKRYKPKIRLIGLFGFDDIEYVYKCHGLGCSGYGETVDESYEDWKETLKLLCWSCIVFVWINELIYKVKEYYGGVQ